MPSKAGTAGAFWGKSMLCNAVRATGRMCWSGGICAFLLALFCGPSHAKTVGLTAIELYPGTMGRCMSRYPASS